MAHQSLGAHLLGLDDENANMARLFAASASAERGYFPTWSFGFDGSTYPMDYINDSYFVRELPEPFDLVHRLGGLLDWDDSPRWYNEPVMVNFYRNIFGPGNRSFLARNFDSKRPGIARWTTRPGADADNIFTGVASYNEQAGAPLAVAGDSIGMQYGAELAHARLCRARIKGCNASLRADASCGKEAAEAAALASEQRAAYIREEYARQWVATSSEGNGGAKGYIRGFLQNDSKLEGWGQMENVIPLVVGLAPANTPATDASLAQLVQQSHALTEIRSQIPEALWRYGRPDEALGILRQFQRDPRKTYPEVSFAFVENCVAGLLGLAPDASAHSLRTRHRLGTTVDWAAAANIPVGSHTISVRHDASDRKTNIGSKCALRSTISHIRYSEPLPTGGSNGGAWGYDHADNRIPAPPAPPGAAQRLAPALHVAAEFAGRHSDVYVDGTKTNSIAVVFQQGDTRLPLTQVNVSIAEGQTVVIEAVSTLVTC
eukprot:SAG31_NODE_3128_length_4646_cov_3.749285_5_plen_489_part_00